MDNYIGTVRHIIVVGQFLQKPIPMDKSMCYPKHWVELGTHKKIFGGLWFMGIKIFNKYVGFMCVYI
jgi:hypothetical protein